MTEKIQILLNSKRANKYINNKTSDCVFYLPNIDIKKYKNIKISVNTAQIPYSFYNVNSTNDKLVYNFISIGISNTIYLNHQNYNVNSLKTELLSHLGNDFSITYSNSKNKFTFTHSTYDFEFEAFSNCFELLGFDDETDNSSSGRVLESTNSVNLFTIRNIYITSDNFILNNINSYTPKQSNILCSIPISSMMNSIISYSNIHNIDSEINHVNNLSHLHIKLTDQDGDIIELNKCHWSMTLILYIN
jgi:hypothetical protein